MMTREELMNVAQAKPQDDDRNALYEQINRLRMQVRKLTISKGMARAALEVGLGALTPMHAAYDYVRDAEWALKHPDAFHPCENCFYPTEPGVQRECPACETLLPRPERPKEYAHMPEVSKP